MPDLERLGDKVYSPDLTSFEFEGPTGLFGVIASVFVGPVRIVMRVMHNIFVLPAHLMMAYANSLLFTSSVLLVLGVVDYLVFNRWPLFVSQPLLILYALHLKRKASRGVAMANKKREVELDTDAIEEICDEVVPAMENILNNGGSHNE